MKPAGPRAAGAAVLLVLTSGCVAPAPEPKVVYSPCRALGTSDWKAEVRIFPSAHPWPILRRKLIVTGKVTVPEGYGADIALGPVSRLDEPVQQILIRTDGVAATGAADPVTYSVKGTFPAIESYGGIAIRCGDGIVSEIDEVAQPAE